MAAPAVAVLGFRPHTYWTAAVALGGKARAPRVLERRRIEFATGNERFAFHQAAEGPIEAAEAFIEGVRLATTTHAVREIGGLIADLEGAGLAVRTAVAPAANPRCPDRLEDILRSHSSIHTAEGNFYRQVVADACAELGLEVRRVAEKALPGAVSEALRIDAAVLEERLKAMGAALGPPWSVDQKLAVQAAWTAL